MESNWAAEHLQTIRTLMERSAVYRRALAPIMLSVGLMGLLAAGAGLVFHFDSTRAFVGFWLGTAVVAVAGALLITRRQALKDGEAFWSPPTRRVTQALLPPLTAGLCVSLVAILVLRFDAGNGFNLLLALVWLLFYGCALHAAGFFMPRGVRLFGWICIILACGSLFLAGIVRPDVEINAHWLMGFFFGVLHLAYGAYLYLTEKGKNAA
jgi:hypothetical protein